MPRSVLLTCNFCSLDHRGSRMQEFGDRADMIKRGWWQVRHHGRLRTACPDCAPVVRLHHEQAEGIAS